MCLKPWCSAVLILFVWAGSGFPQQTTSDKKAEQQNRDAAGDQTGAVLDVKPGSPTIKTKDITQERKLTPWLRLPRYVLQDQKAMWTSPLHTSRSDAKWWAIFGGSTAALLTSDKWTSKQLPNTADQLTFAKWTSRFGGAPTLLSESAAFYFVGLGAGNQRFRETGILGFEALADTSIMVGIVKLATHRERPLEGNGDGKFWSAQGSVWNSSFPSGHAMNSWAFASIVAHEYPHPRIVPILAYSLATVVVGSRFAARKHFGSDVVLGAAIGWFTGDYVYAKRHNRELEKRSTLDRVLAHVHVGGPTELEMPDRFDLVKERQAYTSLPK